MGKIDETRIEEMSPISGFNNLNKAGTYTLPTKSLVWQRTAARSPPQHQYQQALVVIWAMIPIMELSNNYLSKFRFSRYWD
jgi:hypothetical protein